MAPANVVPHPPSHEDERRRRNAITRQRVLESVRTVDERTNTRPPAPNTVHGRWTNYA